MFFAMIVQTLTGNCTIMGFENIAIMLLNSLARSVPNFVPGPQRERE